MALVYASQDEKSGMAKGSAKSLHAHQEIAHTKPMSNKGTKLRNATDQSWALGKQLIQIGAAMSQYQRSCMLGDHPGCAGASKSKAAGANKGAKQIKMPLYQVKFATETVPKAHEPSGF